MKINKVKINLHKINEGKVKMNIKIVLLLTYVVIAIAGNSKSIEHFKYTEQREKINIEDNVRRYKTKTLKNVNYE